MNMFECVTQAIILDKEPVGDYDGLLTLYYVIALFLVGGFSFLSGRVPFIDTQNTIYSSNSSQGTPFAA